MYVLSATSKKHREGIDSRLIEISDLAITLTAIDFGHPKTGGLRTVEMQQELHMNGVSPYCDGLIRRSKHQSGKALDFYAYVDDRASWDEYHLAMVAAAFLQAAAQLGHKLKWGGLWTKRKDYPHVELID